MKVWWRCAAALVLVVLGSVGTSDATWECAVEVAQPLVTEEGIYIGRVTYMDYRGGLIPGCDVPFVGKANAVIDELDRPVNRNVANLLGIRIDVDPLHVTGALFGDTLRVYIDLSSMGSAPSNANWTTSGAIAATVECVLTAAAASRSGWAPAHHPWDQTSRRMDAKYVDLRVHGKAEHTGLSRVYSFESLGPMPRERVFK